MTHPSKRKGDSFEREIVAILQQFGIAAEKVPLSGAVKGGSFDHDVSCPVRGLDRKIECKRRARAFGTLYALLGSNDFLAVRDDRTAPLIVMRLDTFAELAK
jgi:hypothetical protein